MRGCRGTSTPDGGSDGPRRIACRGLWLVARSVGRLAIPDPRHPRIDCGRRIWGVLVRCERECDELTDRPLQRQFAVHSLSAGTWTTVGESSFIPGLSITVPDGWSSHEADALELKLIPLDHPDDAVFFWKDVVAIESNGETPEALTGVPGTPEGLTASFRQNPDFVVSTPTKTTIAGDVPALTYTLGVSPSAAYTSQGCPSYPTCANILKDPVHGVAISTGSEPPR